MQESIRLDFRDEISRNKRNSFFLILLVFLILVCFGFCISFAFGDEYFFIILIFSIIFSVGYVFFSYYNSASIAIASVGAKKANLSSHRDYYNLVEGLTLASGLPMPELYIMDSNQINAFASGRDPKHAVICVTQGALKKLDRRELEGVLAHELSHVANYDIRFMTLVSVMIGIISIMAEIFLRGRFNSNDSKGKAGAIFLILGILLAILAPIVVRLIQFAISRRREYASDASAVKFTRYPLGLIGALKKIKLDYSPSEVKVNKALAPLFFSNPLKNLTSTHPPIEERIKKLESM